MPALSVMLRPTAVKTKEDYLIEVTFDNGEIKVFDVKPYIKGAWYGQLEDINYFNSATTDGYTVVWPNGQDLCPDELYKLSV